MPLLIIARLTLFELVRRRVVGAVAALTAICVGLTGWAFYKLHEFSLAHSSAAAGGGEEAMANAMQVILLAHMFGMVLAVGGAFLAAPSIASDIESGIALAILPRPLRRRDVVLGRFLGLAVAIGAYVFITGALEFSVIHAITGYAPPHPAAALAYISSGAVVLLALGIAGSTRFSPIAVGIVCVALYGVAWIAQVADAVATAYHNGAIRTACTIVSLIVPTGGLWRGAIFSLEPTLMVAASAQLTVNPITVTSPPTHAYLIWTALWVAGMLVAAIASFERRDV
ncbi:MAG TPA: ABC transporter permease [Candidatus Eremiobacteraceae bacterium]|nr:ABC transporter permease [Candidatus Eremiobacteraceae bacterium]